MNHWFLCARDVMWFAIAISPLTLSALAGNKEAEFPPPQFLAAIVIQTLLLLLLWDGIIK